MAAKFVVTFYPHTTNTVEYYQNEYPDYIEHSIDKNRWLHVRLKSGKYSVSLDSVFYFQVISDEPIEDSGTPEKQYKKKK
jgi:hypothetical protein